MIDPHKPKYHPLYWSMVEAAAAQSVATRHQVGAVVVTPTGMISPGWNGMPPGEPNQCEVWNVALGRMKTKPDVIHAEDNAIRKMEAQNIPVHGSVLFVSRAPCLKCANRLKDLGLKAIFYQEDHDDMRGVELLKKTGNFICRQDKMISVQEPSGLSML